MKRSTVLNLPIQLVFPEPSCVCQYETKIGYTDGAETTKNENCFVVEITTVHNSYAKPTSFCGSSETSIELNLTREP